MNSTNVFYYIHTILNRSRRRERCNACCYKDSEKTRDRKKENITGIGIKKKLLNFSADIK